MDAARVKLIGGQMGAPRVKLIGWPMDTVWLETPIGQPMDATWSHCVPAWRPSSEPSRG